ncbi:YcxB family protein [Asticcacaulis solisilvae]|uniref:YcxB family protein n=1 Tax=Asticcacaulis solisilvae TaxID=1217274 RepID=UPI003FD7D370
MSQERFETRSHSVGYGDYAAYAIRTFYRSLLTVKGGLFHLVIAALAILRFALPPLMRGDIAGALPGLLGYPAIILIAGPCLFAARVLWGARTSPIQRAPRVVAFSPDAMTITRGGLDATLGWGTFRTVYETRGAIYLMRVVEAHIVPKSAFASPELARQAAAHARHHIKYATDKATRVFYDSPAPAAPAEDERVSPSFELTFRLFAEIFLRNRYRSVGAVAAQFAAAALVIAAYAWIWRYDLSNGEYGGFLMASGIVVSAILILPVLLIPVSWKMSQKVPTVMGLRQVAMTPSYVRGFGKDYDARFAWQDLRRVVRTSGALFCYTRPNGMVVVPASAFATQAEADAFFDQARAWADAARAK